MVLQIDWFNIFHEEENTKIFIFITLIVGLRDQIVKYLKTPIGHRACGKYKCAI